MLHAVWVWDSRQWNGPCESDLFFPFSPQGLLRVPIGMSLLFCNQGFVSTTLGYCPCCGKHAPHGGYKVFVSKGCYSQHQLSAQLLLIPLIPKTSDFYFGPKQNHSWRLF